MQQFPREQTHFSEPVHRGRNYLPSNSALGLKSRGQLWKIIFPPPSSHQQTSLKLFDTCIKPNRRREVMRTSDEIQLYSQSLNLSTRNDEAETTAKKSSCMSSLFADFSQLATSRFALFTKFIGQTSELLSAMQPQCPAGRGQLKVPDKHIAGSWAALAEAKISSLTLLTHLFAHSSNSSEWHDWPKRHILHQLKWGGAFAPTRTSGFHRRSWGRNSSEMKQKP